MLRRFYAHLARQCSSLAAICLLQSALAAMCLATLCLQLVSIVGTSPPAWLALCAALALGLTWGGLRRFNRPGLQFAGAPNAILLPFALAAWMVGSRWVVELVNRSMAVPGVISLTSPAWNAFALFVVLALALIVPAHLAARIAQPQESPPAGPMRLPLVFLGAAGGLTAWGVGAAQILGPWMCGILASGSLLTIALVRWYRQSDTEHNAAHFASSPVEAGTQSGDMTSPNGLSAMVSVHDARGGQAHFSRQIHVLRLHAQPTARDAMREKCPSPRPLNDYSAIASRILVMAMAAGCGGWLAVVGRLLEQWMPGSVDLACAESIGLCLGVAAGALIAGKRRGSALSIARVKAWALGGVAVWGVCLVAAFPMVVSMELWLNAYVATPRLLLVLRGSLAAATLLPVGIAGGLSFAAPTGTASDARRLSWLAAVFAGYSFFSLWMFHQFSLGVVLIGLAWFTLGVAAFVGVTARGTQPTGRWRRGLAAGAAAVVVAAPVWRANLDVLRSAKVLFNGNASFAYRSGLDPRLLAALDDARPVSTAIGDRGIYTVWRFGGHQLQIRENGIPRGVASTDSRTSPRFVPETLPSALPLVLHDHPARLLLMGLGSGESLGAALQFPVPEIVFLEADAGLVNLVRTSVYAHSGANPFDDDRVAFSICDPALGLGAVRGKFDVIVSCPEHLALVRSQPYLTAEFYRRAAARLTPRGVFCQRLQVLDFGPRVLQTIIGTVQSVFNDAIILEVAPGELLLAASNDDRGLVRPGLAARFEHPHVRALFGQSGVDWSVILNLDGANREALANFYAGSHGALNTAAAGRLPLSMPREVMRWASKPQEVHQALIPRGGRLLSWIGEDADSPVLLRRLSEVKGQFDLMTRCADQFWAYRATLRDQVKEKPRSQIQQASATDEKKQMHAEDHRRVRYFEALGRAVRSTRAADIERLAGFASPYDPLISYFVHEESAELYARSTERNVAIELRHRLYATFFSSPRDASLRNVIAALSILREHPDAEPDPVARWDDLNALLEALKMRWEARAGVRPTNIRQVMNDIDTTILAVEQTFHGLDELTAEAGVPPDFWKARRTVLEKTLIRPVRNYQLELQPHLRRSQAEAIEDVEPGAANSPLLQMDEGG